MTASTQSFKALAQIAEKINQFENAERLLQEVLQIATQTLEAERGFILLKDEHHPTGLSVCAHHNISDDQLQDVVQYSTSVVQQSLSAGEPVLSQEIQKDDRFGHSESIVIQNIRAIACVPLFIKAKRIGAIYLDATTKRDGFSMDNLPFLEAFANLSAVALENVRLTQALRDENSLLKQEVLRTGFKGIIGNSKPMQKLYELMSKLLEVDASVLITGESGAGKELIAKAIHEEGHRKDKAMVTVFCGSLPDNLLESELFGYKKGAFTGAVSDKKGIFEAADGGTVFLDEVGDLGPALQTALLRVLQFGEVRRLGDVTPRFVDVRIISATNKDIPALIEDGSFREDLYYRMNTITIKSPALRERGQDIVLIAHAFLTEFGQKSKRDFAGFTPDAVQALLHHSWPGNVRELRNTIERGVILATNNLIDATDLGLKVPEISDDEISNAPVSLSGDLKAMTKQVTLARLDELNGNLSQTAKSLGVSRSWLHYRMKEWEIVN